MSSSANTFLGKEVMRAKGSAAAAPPSDPSFICTKSRTAASSSRAPKVCVSAVPEGSRI